VIERGEHTLKQVVEESGRDFAAWNQDWDNKKQQFLDEQEQRLVRRETKRQEMEEAKKMPVLTLTKEQVAAKKEEERRRMHAVAEDKKSFEQHMGEQTASAETREKITELRRERQTKKELEREEKERAEMLKHDRTVIVNKVWFRVLPFCAARRPMKWHTRVCIPTDWGCVLLLVQYLCIVCFVLCMPCMP
jgi:hypothetical protein